MRLEPGGQLPTDDESHLHCEQFFRSHRFLERARLEETPLTHENKNTFILDLLSTKVFFVTIFYFYAIHLFTNIFYVYVLRWKNILLLNLIGTNSKHYWLK